ncbi:MAG: hypothetical protein WAK94_10635 [Steroidobacteraceae bacterium]
MRPEHSAAATLTACLAALTAGCAGFMAGRANTAPAPPASPVSSSATQLTQDLGVLQRLQQGAPAQQAEIAADAQREYDTAPTPSRELKLALVLATPGHPATNLPKAQGLLRELTANPQMLTPAERSLSALELSQIDDYLTLTEENRRLQSDAAHAAQEHAANANHRLQTEMDENARLRKELDEAHAKLDAIANIERSLNERKAPDGRSQ